MDDSRGGKWSAGLPYINSIQIVLLTAAINAAAVFLFFWGKPLTFEVIVVDACVCGITTSLIDVFVVSVRMRKLRARGQLPKDVPTNRLMAAMPKNPLLLALVFGVAFGLLSPLFNALVIRFYEIASFSFARFAVWRILYTLVLSAKIVELAILRYAQPGCTSESDVVQQGTEAVVDPLPRLSTIKQWYRAVADDFGFNILVGLLLGGTIIKDHLVILPPVTLDGITISALILGVIITARMAYPVAKSIRDLRESGGLPISGTENKRLSWMPYSPLKFALLLMLPIMGISLMAIWAVMSFFGFEVLNFFQYFVIRTLFVSLLTKPVVKLAILRYTQPQMAREKE